MGIWDMIKKNMKSSPAPQKLTEADIEKCRRDFATALMLNGYGLAHPVMPSNNYPCFFERECGVTNPKLFHQSLIDDGYFQKASTTDILNTLTLPALKLILQENGLPKTGRKAELIDRIINSVDLKQSTLLKGKVRYSLSDKGKAWLSENMDYVYLHKHNTWLIPFREYCSLRLQYGSNHFYQIAEQFLTNRLKSSPDTFSKGTYYSYMSIVYKNTDRNEECLLCYLRTLFLRLNSEVGYDEYTISIFPAEIVTSIALLQDYFSEDMLDTIFKERLCPARHCTKDDFTNIVFDIFNDVAFPYEKWNNYLYKKAGIKRR